MNKRRKEKRPRFRRTEDEIADGMSIEQAIEARKTEEETEDRQKKPEKRRKPSKPKSKTNQYQVKPKSHCGLKIIASVVKVHGESRVKISRNYPSDLAPCEELVFKITFERDGIPVNTMFDQVRKFATAIAHCMDTELE